MKGCSNSVLNPGHMCDFAYGRLHEKEGAFNRVVKRSSFGVRVSVWMALNSWSVSGANNLRQDIKDSEQLSVWVVNTLIHCHKTLALFRLSVSLLTVLQKSVGTDFLQSCGHHVSLGDEHPL